MSVLWRCPWLSIWCKKKKKLKKTCKCKKKKKCINRKFYMIIVSCCSKLVWLTFFCRTQMNICWRMLRLSKWWQCFFFGELVIYWVSTLLFLAIQLIRIVCLKAVFLNKEATTYGRDSNILCMSLNVFPDWEEVCVSFNGN